LRPFDMDRIKVCETCSWFVFSEGLTSTTSVSGLATHLDGL
jgi:hypothetical protein